MLLILGVGLYLTVRLGVPQLVLLPRALRLFFRRLVFPEKKEGVSSFQALCTALAATVGTGNLVGVAGAICLGGPGAIFWMWVCGFLGMATKFSETALAVRYRVKTPAGFSGGPMYVMTRGLGEKFRPMAKLYCLFGILAAVGVGNAAQINAVVTGCNGILTRLGGSPGLLGNLLLGIGMALAVGLALAAGLVDWPFTLVRVFAFYPFYACGVLLRPQLDRLAAFAAEHRPVRLVAAAGLVLGYGAYFLWVLRADPIMDHSAELFHDVSYAGGDRVQYRVVFYLVGIATTAALTVLASRWHLLAELGRHTLALYLFHQPVWFAGLWLLRTLRG